MPSAVTEKVPTCCLCENVFVQEVGLALYVGLFACACVCLTQ